MKNLKQAFLFVMIVFILIPSFSNIVLAASPEADKTDGKRVIPIVKMSGKDGSFTADNKWIKTKSDKETWRHIMGNLRYIVTGVSGIAALSMILIFIKHLVSLASSSSNPSERSKATMGLLWSGIATVGLGGITLFVAFFYNAI